MLKKLLCLAIGVTMILGIEITSLAQNKSLGEVSAYQESYLYLDFNNIDVISTNDGWKIVPVNNLSRIANANVEEDIEKLQSLITEFPGIEENLFNTSSEDELIAVSFTEVPLVRIDNHYERIPVDINTNTRGNASSPTNGKGKFLLYTTISGGTTSASGGYKYTANTYGYWSENNLLGGEKYPASGNDYIFQTSPNTFSRISDSLTAHYDYGPTTGVSGDDFWRENGSASYVRYCILDDPFGYRQNTSFALTTTSVAPKSNSVRQIGSYYIHTWSSMNIDASVDFSSDKSVTLSIHPSITKDSWQVYNYVPFSF